VRKLAPAALLCLTLAPACVTFAPLSPRELAVGKDLGHVRVQLPHQTVELADAKSLPGVIEGRPEEPVLLEEGIRAVDPAQTRVEIPRELVVGPIQVRRQGTRTALVITGIVVLTALAAVGAVVYTFETHTQFYN